MKTLLISSLSLLVGVSLGLFVGLQIAHRYKFHVVVEGMAIYRCDTFTGEVSVGSAAGGVGWREIK